MATVNFGYNALGQRSAYTSTTAGHAELPYAAHMQYRDGQQAQAVVISGTTTGTTSYTDTYLYDQGGNPLELVRARRGQYRPLLVRARWAGQRGGPDRCDRGCGQPLQL